MKLLFIISRPPSDTVYIKDSLDAALTSGVFDQEVSLLFIDEGLQQLIPEHSGDELAEQLRMLGLYGVDKVYIHDKALQTHKTGLDELTLSPSVLTNAEIGLLVSSHDTVFHF